MAVRILILCTGNSSRSQMAEGLLRSFDSNLEVFSAGTNPASRISSHTVTVMKEIDIDISGSYPKSVSQFISQSFHYVITVCDHAKETCPVFTGKVINQIHIGFDDPSKAHGNEEEILIEYRRVRDDMRARLLELFKTIPVSGKG